MQIQGQGLSSLQRIQTQQAFQTKKARPVESDNLQELPSVEVSRQPVTASLPGHIFTPKRLSEIKNIAQQAGYVGLNDTDIARAYATGESLLTDYRA